MGNAANAPRFAISTDLYTQGVCGMAYQSIRLVVDLGQSVFSMLNSYSIVDRRGEIPAISGRENRTEAAMTNLLRPTEIDEAVALEWLRYSLSQGHVISPNVFKIVRELDGHSYALVPKTVDPARLTTPQWGGVVEQGAGSRLGALALVLKALIEKGAACVVVEDEARLKHDSKPSVDGLLRTAFVGERVIHWAALVGGTESAILTLHRGSGGYPLNAFVTSASEQDLCLVDGADLDQGIGSAVAQSILAVIVAAYDDETFMIWEPR